MSPLAEIAAIVVAVPAMVLAAEAAYLIVLSIAGLVRHEQPPPQSGATRRFAILVPAHDEAASIGRVVRELRAQEYPRDRFDVFVVADNCTDATATIAWAEGAIVHERTEPHLRAKGHALRWLLDRVRAHGAYDAYVVVDADSELSRDFIARMNARLAAGALVVQAHYRVRNTTASDLAALREAALASLHYLRPLGREALGLSCGLKGNGMCFAAQVLDHGGWSSVGLAEDVELHLALVQRGVRTHFAPEALVRADMPETYAAASSQNLRWEAGRLSAVRSEVAHLLLDGLKRGSAMRLDAAIEQLVPPLSIAVTASVACALAGYALASPAVAWLGAFAAAAFIAHVILGMVAARSSRRTYGALLRAPLYVAWKLALYARAIVASPTQPWVRTRRGGTMASQREQ